MNAAHQQSTSGNSHCTDLGGGLQGSERHHWGAPPPLGTCEESGGSTERHYMTLKFFVSMLASHLALFWAWDSSPYYPVTPPQLIGILHSWWLCITSSTAYFVHWSSIYWLILIPLHTQQLKDVQVCNSMVWLLSFFTCTVPPMKY